MKIAYIANIRFPTERAHGFQIAKMCEAFLLNEVEIELVIPQRNNPFENQDPMKFYDLKNRFDIQYLKSSNYKSTRLGALWNLISFNFKVLSYLSFKKDIVVFSRDKTIILVASLLGRKTFYEIHQARRGFLEFIVSRIATGVIFISYGLEKFYKEIWKNKPTLVAHDAFDERDFKDLTSKEDLRVDLNLPQNKQIVLFAGHFHPWNGVEILASVAKDFPEVIFILIGGVKEKIKIFKEKFTSSNLKFLEFQPHALVPKYLKSADLLIIPSSAKYDVTKFYASPMKLFEYMASGTPILASDLPSLREILNENIAYFFEPNDDKSLRDNLHKILKDDFKSKKAELAKDMVNQYTWKNRAKKIISFIKKHV